MSYDWDGTCHLVVANFFSFCRQEDWRTIEFQAFLALEKSSQWEELIRRADREVARAPTWLTPGAFKAEALFILGREAEGLELLRKIDRETKGNAQFDAARKVLAKLEELAKKPEK